MWTRLFSFRLEDRRGGSVPQKQISVRARSDQEDVLLTFGTWLGERLPVIVGDLDIKQSRYVSPAIKRRFVGIDDVISSYCWTAAWTDRYGKTQTSGSWPTTKATISKLRAWLEDELLNPRSKDKDILAACLAVVEWGGGLRSQGAGADKFLRDLAEGQRLKAYLREAASIFRLDGEGKKFQSIRCMNSMMTKVHSFIATDGLPIYDSRVAATAGCLAELFRLEALDGGALPPDITFPAAPVQQGRNRAVTSLFKEPSPTGVLTYSQEGAVRWADAKWRLGRVLRQAVASNRKLAGRHGSPVERMHALEAGFFMLGYDVNCLREATMQVARPRR